MKHLFVPYELALLAKEKTFDEECLGHYYTNIEGTLLMEIPQNGQGFFSEHNSDQAKPENCAAPLYQQLVDWFRDVHHLHFYIGPYGDSASWSLQSLEGWQLNNIGKTNVAKRDDRLFFQIRSKYQYVKFDSYYAALDAALTEAFKLI